MNFKKNKMDDFYELQDEEDFEISQNQEGVINIYSDKKRDTAGIGTTISHVLSSTHTTELITARRNGNPYLQPSFISPPTCTGCGKSLNFLLAYSYLRQGSSFDETLSAIDAKRICCRNTVLEDPISIEIYTIAQSERFQTSEEREEYLNRDQVIIQGRKVEELQHRLSALPLTDEMKNVRIRLENELEETISLLDSLQNQKDIEGKTKMVDFLTKYTITQEMNLPGVIVPLFDYDGFISSTYLGEERVYEEMIEEDEESTYFEEKEYFHDEGDGEVNPDLAEDDTDEKTTDDLIRELLDM